MEHWQIASEPTAHRVLDRSLTVGTAEELEELRGYTQITGHLTIRGANLKDLSPLSELTSILGSLSIIGCHQLRSIRGLQHLNFVGEGILISNNAQLVQLTEFGGLRHVGNNIIVMSNPKLETLRGLWGVTGR
ncbi:MAG: hypothetical protein VX834_08990, partial [Myxococcota bacterium]|nr:hypothetical protein [Myxococcota bacterium]